MTHLEVKSDGLIYLIKDCPEEPPVSASIYSDMAKMNRYDKALASCERIKCADQQQARDLVMRKSSMGKGKDGFYEPTIGIYSLPDVEWEVREVPIERGPSTFSHYEREAGKQLVTEFERLAILK